jgi:hypothetical protein
MFIYLFTPGTIKIQYKLGAGSEIHETAVSEGLELEEIRKIIQALHPEARIEKLYKGQAELDGADSSTDIVEVSGMLYAGRGHHPG